MGTGQVLENFDVRMPEKFSDAVFVDLNGGNVLFLLDINMSNIQPNIGKVCCCFTDLKLIKWKLINDNLKNYLCFYRSENVASFWDTALVS